MNARDLTISSRAGKPRALLAAFVAAAFVVLLLVAALPKAAQAADDYEPATSSEMTAQAGGLAVSPGTVDFALYPGYTQGQSVRAITVTNNTGATVTNIHFANFHGTQGTFADGSKNYAPYGVVDTENGAYFITDNFFGMGDDGSIAWTDWAIENGYTTLAAGQSRTYYLALEVGGLWNWSTLVNGTDLTDTVDLVSSAGTTTLTLRTRVHEPAKGIVTAQIGTKPDATTPEVSPVSSITLANVAAGVEGPTATLFGLQNTSSAVDPVTGQVPNVVIRSAGIEDDSAGIFGLIVYQGTWGQPIGDGNLNNAIGPGATMTFGVAADARYLPAGTYTANVRLWVVPSTITLNSGVQVGQPNPEGYTPITIPVSVTVVGNNPNLRPAPDNLKAEAANGAVVLTWDAVPENPEGYDGYIIWRTGGGEDMIEYVYGTETQFIDRDVVNGTTYTYYVGCQNGGTDEQDARCPKAGPVSATPSASAPARLDQPWIDVNLTTLTGAVRAEWRLQDWSDSGAGTVDHFNVYLNKKKVTEVKQSAVQVDDGDYFWTCDIPVAVPWQEYYVNVAAVSTDGAEGFWSDTAFGQASSDTPSIESAGLMWDHESRTVQAFANVWVSDDAGGAQVRIDRDGTAVATVAAGDYFYDESVQAGQTYAYTFTAVAGNGKSSEPYRLSIYTNPGDYANTSSLPVTVSLATGGNGEAVNISVGTETGSTYVVGRDGNDEATTVGTGTSVHFVDYPGTGVHTYIVEQHDENGNVVATSVARSVEVTADGQPGAMTVVDGAFAMHRVYNPNSYEHFYTSDDAEFANLVSLGWRDEGYGWIAPATGEPVYRLYNPNNGGDHHYTKNADERDMLVGVGWRDEGVGWYSASETSGTPVFREYNPNELARNHNYTKDKDEHSFLVSLGWHDEGTAWYGFAG